ncbi:hypothetical protein LTR97_009596 [Elasticomyces elasticus]|uniref:Uncharacterized protein n=1 Tax=Elasticomyces elasticus TaxID=574655 RepID=A0AAN7W1X9_9PEZI|nr:hypothetical protein LTR97_009596 [Elasticomyces elasticus]
MAPRRSKRIAGEVLDDDFEAIASTATATAHQRAPTRRSERVASKKLGAGAVSQSTTSIQYHRATGTRFKKLAKSNDNNAPPTAQTLRRRRAKVEKTYSQVSCRFRLFDLPPELREFVYIYAMELDRPHPVGEFRFPGLAMVSRQVRAEALPIFFAQGLFEGLVVSNHTDIKNLEAQRLNPIYQNPQIRAEAKAAELKRRAIPTLKFTERSTAALAALQTREQYTPLFRNVQLRAFAGYRDLVAQKLKVDELTLGITVPTATQVLPHLALVEARNPDLFAEEISNVLGKVSRRMNEIAAAQERFLGFSLQHVEEIAAEFRYEVGYE